MKKNIITQRMLFIIVGFLFLLYPNTQAKAGEGEHYLQACERVLAEDDFTNGDKWNVNQNVSFTDGAATIKGSGPCNRMGYKAGKINADNFLIQLDLMPNEGNTQSNAKIAFKIEDQYEGDRLQVRFDFTKTTENVLVERSSDNSGAGTKAWSQSSDFAFETGKTYAIDILVKDNNVKVYIGDSGTPVLDVIREEIGTMDKGYFAIAGQYPA